jgi:hypothetical protein
MVSAPSSIGLIPCHLIDFVLDPPALDIADGVDQTDEREEFAGDFVKL